MLKKEELSKPLLKKAQGFSENEVTEEYEEDEGGLKLKKRKVSTKYFPPDISAAKLLLLLDEQLNLSDLTEEELNNMRKKLIAELKTETLKIKQKGDEE